MSPRVGSWILIRPLQPRKRAQFQYPVYEFNLCHHGGNITRGVHLIYISRRLSVVFLVKRLTEFRMRVSENTNPIFRRSHFEIVSGSHAHAVGTSIMNYQPSTLKATNRTD